MQGYLDHLSEEDKQRWKRNPLKGIELKFETARHKSRGIDPKIQITLELAARQNIGVLQRKPKGTLTEAQKEKIRKKAREAIRRKMEADPEYLRKKKRLRHRMMNKLKYPGYVLIGF